MVKGFKIVYYCTQAANMEMTVNRECDNYMNQMFKTCENAYKVFYDINYLEICKSCKVVPEGSYVKKD